jgi:hypothetical protein
MTTTPWIETWMMAVAGILQGDAMQAREQRGRSRYPSLKKEKC